MSTAQADSLGAVLPTSVLDLRPVRSRHARRLAGGQRARQRIRRSESAGRGIRSIPTAPSASPRPRSCSGEFAYTRHRQRRRARSTTAWRAAFIPEPRAVPDGHLRGVQQRHQGRSRCGAAGGRRCRACRRDRRRQRQHLRRLLRAAVHPHRRHATRDRCRVTRGPRRSTPTPSPTARAACRRWTAASCGSSARTTSRGAATSSTPTACTSSGSASRATPSCTRRGTAPTCRAAVSEHSGLPGRHRRRSQRSRQPWHDVRRRWLGARRRLSAASLSSRWQLDS